MTYLLLIAVLNPGDHEYDKVRESNSHERNTERPRDGFSMKLLMSPDSAPTPREIQTSPARTTAVAV